jgi:hypothetical protein
MRLLNTSTIELQEFPTPPAEYTILGHTWGEGEGTLQSLAADTERKLPGWTKILKCCEIAAKDNWKDAWIDTCCP